MSEYKPITGELRDWFEHAYSYDVGETPWFGWKSTIEQMLDAIDSIHAALEADNERLRGEWDYWESTHVELPKDMDGEPIRIGDVMELPTTGETFEVVGIGDGVLFYVEDGSEQADWTGASTKRHHVPDTWASIIEDAIGDRIEDKAEFDKELDALVARCKTLAGDAE